MFMFALSCLIFYSFFSKFGSFWLLQMWPDLVQKAKEGGLDVIQTYVFWNGHEPAPGKVMKSNIFLKRKKNLFS